MLESAVKSEMLLSARWTTCSWSYLAKTEMSTSDLAGSLQWIKQEEQPSAVRPKHSRPRDTRRGVRIPSDGLIEVESEIEDISKEPK